MVDKKMTKNIKKSLCDINESCLMIVDIQEKMSLYGPIQIAGTATLTCYLIPYFFNSFRTLLGIQLPLFLTTGLLGLLKSIVYSFIIITIAWGLKRAKIQLKI